MWIIPKTAGMCPTWCGSYKRFFDVGGGIGILRRGRAGSTSSRGVATTVRPLESDSYIEYVVTVPDQHQAQNKKAEMRAN